MGRDERAGAAALRLLRSAPCYVWSCEIDASGEVANVQVTKGISMLTGGRLTPDGTTVEAWSRLIHPNDRERMHVLVGQLFSGALQRADVQYRLLVNEHDARWVRDLITVTETDTGRLVEGLVIGIGGVDEGPVRFRADDVSPTVANAAQSLDSRILLVVTDASGACTHVNEQWTQLTGRPIGDALGAGWAEVIHREDVDRVLSLWTDARASGRPLQVSYRVVAVDGRVTPVHVQIEPQRDNAGAVVGFVGVVTDLSALTATHEELHHERDLNRHIIASTTDGIVAFDRDMCITAWNPAMERIAGVPGSEVLGRNSLEVFPFLLEHGEVDNMRAVLSGEQPAAAARPFHIDFTGKTGYYETRYAPLRSARGDIIGGLVVVRDTTDVKALQAQLVHSEKLAVMGQIGAGIAHELNQPLTGLRMLVSRLNERRDLSVSAVADDLKDIEAQIARMGRIISNVRQLAHKGEFSPQVIPAYQPLDNTLQLLGEAFRLASVTVVRELPNDLPFLLGDATQLQQVFMNLLSNALHAVRDGGADPATVYVGARRTGGAVTFWVEDTGAGVPATARESIFDPFFSTKPSTEGTGLGLSLSSAIVAQHGGALRLVDGRGSGARFELDVPLADRPGPDVQVVASGEPVVQSAARVLVVDDERMLARLISETLGDLGYDCVACTEPQSALDHAGRGSFDLAIVDLRMPTMSGVELCSALRVLQPKLRIVAISGYISENDHSALTELGVQQVVLKPFDVVQLADAATAALAAALG